MPVLSSSQQCWSPVLSSTMFSTTPGPSIMEILGAAANAVCLRPACGIYNYGRRSETVQRKIEWTIWAQILKRDRLFKTFFSKKFSRHGILLSEAVQYPANEEM